MPDRWCAQCGIRPRRPRGRVCNACNAYKGKYGRWPDRPIIHRRFNRDEDQRMMRRARGA